MYRPPVPNVTPPPQTTPVKPATAIKKPNDLGPEDVRIRAVTQEVLGSVRKLRGAVLLETAEVKLTADEVDYDEKSGDAEARGHVTFESYKEGTKLFADKAEYNTERETGKFYNVKGTAPARVDPRPGVLTSDNPFYFEGKWGERIGNRYVLHEGFFTDCIVPKPWWILRAKRFDVIPEDRAYATKTLFRLRGIPLLYSPGFYKSLKRLPRRSGFLTPNLGNSNRRGFMAGFGYFWAINRSYDAMYRGQYFSRRGLAHNLDFRGKPTQNSEFDFIVFGVKDRGLRINDTVIDGSGYQMTGRGKAEFKGGFSARADINYLSSFQFRQQFTESFQEAIFSETKSVAYITKHWSTFGFNGYFERLENFQSTFEGDKVLIRKLPEAQFLSRHRQIRNWPLYWSFAGSGGLLRRTQPQFQSRNFVERLDVEPRLTAPVRLGLITLLPSAAIRGTYYGSSLDRPLLPGGATQVVGDNLFRRAADLSVGLELPALAKVMKAPAWIGTQMKHVVETRANYRYVTGINNFNRIVRFDETELMANTHEVEIGVTNRLYAKQANGATSELLSWDLSWKRFLDPTFGGAVLPGRRNVIESTTSMTGFTFLDGPRSYSPVVSVLRFESWIGAEWRADWDPKLRRFGNSLLSVDGRYGNFLLSLGHVLVRNSPALAGSSNQFRTLVGWGQENRRGWNAAFLADYDYRQRTLRFAQTQVTYNTDCCGFSVQWRRLQFGTRDENQFRVALAIANLGSFGTLRRQERIF